ncbi:hypothetical protein E2C01_055520 [Portunus trituberculatus]|uniref:Uncharacterized protein n=1 Tax=Portunus trituberculatus TaxID=210409 RepID=A0A5B7GX26_PORTR|nr:hypothetical protein [Portunus trituberculatus]
MQNPKHAGPEACTTKRGQGLRGCWLRGFGVGNLWWVALVQRCWGYKFPSICQDPPVGALGDKGGSGEV